MYSILRLQTSPLAARAPTAPTETTFFISIIPFCLPQLKGLLPRKHALSMTIYVPCLKPQTFFGLPLTAVGFLDSPHLPFLESGTSMEAGALATLLKSSPTPKVLLLLPQSYSYRSVGNSLPSPVVHPCAAENSLPV